MEERKAFIRLAITQKTISWVYRRWASEDEARGDLNAYRKHAAEARRLWRDALWHLDYARNQSNG
jgi:hypothetical protein